MAKKIQSEYISIDPERMGGTPVFKGTRVPITTLFDYLQRGTLEDFFEDYSHITKEAVNSVLEYASIKITQKTHSINHESAA
jgi:uncharacterized protein (DUF433 family)